MSLGVQQIVRCWERHPGWRSWPILDVRSAAVYEAGHLKGAVSRPLPPESREVGAMEAQLPSIFLPARHDPLLVVAETQAVAEHLADLLGRRGRQRVQGLGLPAERLAQLPADLVETGPCHTHLWSAPPWLTAHAPWLPPPCSGPVLDLGCGSGRAAVWLAARGYAVTGIDREPEALALGRLLAESQGTRCDFREGDLRDASQVPPGPWSLLLNFRFLQRDLLPLVPRLLQPGGLVLLRTFRQAPGYEGHPHRRHRLDRGELLQRFPRGLFEILAHAEDHDADGRPAAGIVARRTS